MRDWTKSSTQLLHARDSIELNGVQLLVVDLIFQKFFPWLHSSWEHKTTQQQHKLADGADRLLAFCNELLACQSTSARLESALLQLDLAHLESTTFHGSTCERAIDRQLIREIADRGGHRGTKTALPSRFQIARFGRG